MRVFIISIIALICSENLYKDPLHRVLITINMSMCYVCNKSFANKYSLSAHKSRYHRKSDPDKLDDKDSQYPDTLQEYSSHEESDHESESSEKTESGSGADIEQSEAETENAETEETDVENLRDQLSDKHSKRKLNPGELRSIKRTRRNRNQISKPKHLFTEDDDVIKLLSSIDNKMWGVNDEPFSLLFVHRMKQEYFPKLATHYFVSEGEMQHKLSEDEFWLVDAICKNADLEIVRKLFMENIEMIQKMLARLHPKQD